MFHAAIHLTQHTFPYVSTCMVDDAIIRRFLGENSSLVPLIIDILSIVSTVKHIFLLNRVDNTRHQSFSCASLTEGNFENYTRRSNATEESCG